MDFLDKVKLYHSGGDNNS